MGDDEVTAGATYQLARLLAEPDPELTRVLGEIAIAFTHLEHILWLSPKRLASIPFDEYLEVAEDSSIPQRCDDLESNYGKKVMDQQREGRLWSILGRVREVTRRRNEVFHALWIEQQDGKPVRNKQGKILTADLDTMMRLRDDIRAVVQELNSYPW